MKNKQNEANKYTCVLCETGEGERHGLKCSENLNQAIGELLTREKYKFLPNGLLGEICRDFIQLI